MRMIGYALITLGFLTGSFFAVEQVSGIGLRSYLLAVGVGAVGVTLVQVGRRREARHEETLTANIGAIDLSLEAIVERIDALEEGKEAIDVYDLRHRIDEQFPEHLDRFVRARESIAHSFGLQAYADVMNPFAAGERYLNRVWSCSTDGYIDEAHLHVTKARDQFRDALGIFRGLVQSGRRTDASSFD